MLTLIEACGHWNAFDGPAIVRDLRANRGLWRTAVLVGRQSEKVYLDSDSGDFVRSERDFSAHRGLPETLYGFDILQLMPAPGKETDLAALVESWEADSVQWFGLPDAETALEDSDEETYVQAGGDPGRVIVELWWD
jgi:hypothetical protein